MRSETSSGQKHKSGRLSKKHLWGSVFYLRKGKHSLRLHGARRQKLFQDNADLNGCFWKDVGWQGFADVSLKMKTSWVVVFSPECQFRDSIFVGREPKHHCWKGITHPRNEGGAFPRDLVPSQRKIHRRVVLPLQALV